jgi:hypothetical protein
MASAPLAVAIRRWSLRYRASLRMRTAMPANRKWQDLINAAPEWQGGCLWWYS